MAKKISRSRRVDGRSAAELRPVEMTRGYTKFAPGSVLIRMGDTVVLCTACIDEGVPAWMAGKGRGWITSEYDMLPGSTGSRKSRSRKKVDGRSTEIQRLIGRVIRAIVDFEKLGERCIWLDCDVLQADGGTRTAAITGAYVALCDAIKGLQKQKLITESPIIEPIAAISVGKVDGRVLLDLNYPEDSNAEVDANIAMTASGRLVEVQVSAEKGTFDQADLDKMMKTASKGIKQLIGMQKTALAKRVRQPK